MAICTAHFALRDFSLQRLNTAISAHYHSADRIFLLPVNMIKFQNDRIRLTTIQTGMLGQVLHNYLPQLISNPLVPYLDLLGVCSFIPLIPILLVLFLVITAITVQTITPHGILSKAPNVNKLSTSWAIFLSHKAWMILPVPFNLNLIKRHCLVPGR
jgi:hypothetical protein